MTSSEKALCMLNATEQIQGIEVEAARLTETMLLKEIDQLNLGSGRSNLGKFQLSHSYNLPVPHRSVLADPVHFDLIRIIIAIKIFNRKNVIVEYQNLKRLLYEINYHTLQYYKCIVSRDWGNLKG
jgi:hypothetical protein